MRLPNWLHHCKRLAAAATRPARRRKAPTTRLCLEVLEDRTVPSTISGTLTTDTGAPLAGWTVWLDVNNNQRFDPGELSATTGQDGSYSPRYYECDARLLRIERTPGGYRSPRSQLCYHQ